MGEIREGRERAREEEEGRRWLGGGRAVQQQESDQWLWKAKSSSCLSTSVCNLSLFSSLTESESAASRSRVGVIPIAL
jgi:hypothetical protein